MGRGTYTQKSASQKARAILAVRKSHLRRGILAYINGQRERPPVLRKYLPGAEGIYRHFGIEPNVDVFVPRQTVEEGGNTPDWVVGEARRKWNEKKFKERNPVRNEMPTDLGDIVLAVNERNLNE